MKKIKKMFWKHWNCIPWFLVGISIMLDGEIKIYQFFLTWLAVLALIWLRLSLDNR